MAKETTTMSWMIADPKRLLDHRSHPLSGPDLSTETERFGSFATRRAIGLAALDSAWALPQELADAAKLPLPVLWHTFTIGSLRPRLLRVLRRCLSVSILVHAVPRHASVVLRANL